MTLALTLVQADIVWHDRSASLARLEPLVARAAADGAELVVLPEMFAVGFSMDTAVVAEEEDGPTAAWLGRVSAAHGILLGGSIPTRLESGEVRNRFLLAGDGRTWAYDKVKPFTYSGEHEHYAPGPGPVTWDLRGMFVTPFVCYDLRFADLWWDRAPVTDLYLCVASWPASRQSHWDALLRARAIENQAWVAGCNRVGEGGGIAYRGGSRVIDPRGEVVAEAGADEAVVSAVVDAARVADVRRQFPFLADR